MNPFVNLSQRGIDLPPGCKDLIDVLQTSASSLGRRAEHLTLRGWDTESLLPFVQRFYKSLENPSLHLFTETRDLLTLLWIAEKPHLVLTLWPGRSAVKGAIRSLFAASGVSPLTEVCADNFSLISYPLPAAAAQAAELISQFVRQQYHACAMHLIYMPSRPSKP